MTAIPRTGPSGLVQLTTSTTDDPRVVHEAATEDYSLHVVPRSWRMSRRSMIMAWSSLLAAMFWLVLGAAMALTVGSRDALIGIGLSVVTYGLVNYVLATFAARSGLTVALMSRGLFGYLGAAVATLVFAAGAIYYATFEGSVAAVALKTYFGGNLKLWYLVVVVTSVPLVLGGVRRWLEKMNAALLPIFVVGAVVAVVWATVRHGYTSDWLHLQGAPDAVSGPGWLFAFAVYMGVWLMMFYTIDFARFGREEDASFNGVVTFGPAFYFCTLFVNALIGIYLATTLPPAGPFSEAGLVVGIVKLMGPLGVIFILATQTKINSANLYLASTNLESFFSRALGLTLPRTVWVGVAGVSVFLLMLTNVFSFLVTALNYQAVVVVAWVGIALVELTLRRLFRLPAMEFRPGRVPAFYVPGLVSWGVSSAIGIYLLRAYPATAATYGALITFAVSSISYIGLRFASRATDAVRHRPFDPRDEVLDAWEVHVQCHECTKSYIAQEMDRDPTAGHRAVCASCATSVSFLRATAAEASAG